MTKCPREVALGVPQLCYSVLASAQALDLELRYLNIHSKIDYVIVTKPVMYSIMSKIVEYSSSYRKVPEVAVSTCDDAGWNSLYD
eukprot:5000815-Amphidinium_carterae.1